MKLYKVYTYTRHSAIGRTVAAPNVRTAMDLALESLEDSMDIEYIDDISRVDAQEIDLTKMELIYKLSELEGEEFINPETGEVLNCGAYSEVIQCAIDVIKGFIATDGIGGGIV